MTAFESPEGIPILDSHESEPNPAAVASVTTQPPCAAFDAMIDDNRDRFRSLPLGRLFVWIACGLLTRLVIYSSIYLPDRSTLALSTISWSCGMLPFLCWLALRIGAGELSLRPFFAGRVLRRQYPRLALHAFGILAFFIGIDIVNGSVVNRFSLLDPEQRDPTSLLSEQIAANPNVAAYIPAVLACFFLFLVLATVEESFFRGVLLTRWTATRGPVLGIAMSSVIFALFHGWPYFPSMFVFAVLMCLLYRRTGTLWVPIVVHACDNGILTLCKSLHHVPWHSTVAVGFALMAIGIVPCLDLLRCAWPRATRGDAA